MGTLKEEYERLGDELLLAFSHLTCPNDIKVPKGPGLEASGDLSLITESWNMKSSPANTDGQIGTQSASQTASIPGFLAKSVKSRPAACFLLM